MKNKTPFLMATLCGCALCISGCTTSCPTAHHGRGMHKDHQQYQYPQYQHQQHKQHKKHKQKIHEGQPIIFQQTYTGSDVHNVSANMSTRSYTGGMAEMGTIQFKETNDGPPFFLLTT